MEGEQKHWISPKETEKLIIFSEEDGNSFLLMSHSSYCGHTIAYEDPSQQWGSLENYQLRKKIDNNLALDKNGEISKVNICTPKNWRGKHITKYLNQYGFTIYPQQIPYHDSPLSDLIEITVDIKPMAQKKKSPVCVCGPNPGEGLGMEDYYPYQNCVWLKDGDSKVLLAASEMRDALKTSWIDERFVSLQKETFFWYHEQSRLLIVWADQRNAYEFVACHKLSEEYYEKYKEIFDNLPKANKIIYVPAGTKISQPTIPTKNARSAQVSNENTSQVDSTNAPSADDEPFSTETNSSKKACVIM